MVVVAFGANTTQTKHGIIVEVRHWEELYGGKYTMYLSVSSISVLVFMSTILNIIGVFNDIFRINDNYALYLKWEPYFTIHQRV